MGDFVGVLYPIAGEAGGDYMTVINAITSVFNESAVVGVLTAGVGVAIGAVLLWWSTRKVAGMAMKAIKRGKLRI